MLALVQRVINARVTLVQKDEAQEDGSEELLNEIGPGLCVFVCAEKGDDADVVDFYARKISNLRVFEDADGKTNLSIKDVAGEVLLVSQFTLAADWRKGNRPGFSRAAPPDEGEAAYLSLADKIRGEGVPVKLGRFGAHMRVHIANDGPFTIWMGD